jgi:hypothetical protein
VRDEPMEPNLLRLQAFLATGRSLDLESSQIREEKMSVRKEKNMGRKEGKAKN